jgi:hypothetical protein
VSCASDGAGDEVLLTIELVVVDGDYDDAVAAVMKRVETDKGLLMVMDISFEGYEDVQKVSSVPR